MRYFEVLLAMKPAVIGGKLPDEGVYFTNETELIWQENPVVCAGMHWQLLSFYLYGICYPGGITLSFSLVPGKPFGVYGSVWEVWNSTGL